MSWRLTFLAAILGATVLAASAVAPAAAQTPVPTPTTTTYSQMVRAQGHTLSDVEAAFLDADETVQSIYVLVLYNIDLLSQTPAEQRNDQWRQALLQELQRLQVLDPAASPAAPPSLERFREAAIAYRQQVREAANKWAAAVQTNDPEWLQRGIEDYRTSLQRLQAMHQELLNRFPTQQSSQPR